MRLQPRPLQLLQRAKQVVLEDQAGVQTRVQVAQQGAEEEYLVAVADSSLPLPLPLSLALPLSYYSCLGLNRR